MFKNIALFILVLTTGIYAGMIELTDDDPYQTFVFECDPTVHDSVRVWYKTVETDSFLTFITIIPPANVHSNQFNFIQSDRDSNDYIIPGPYDGEYWFCEESFLILGGSVMSEDTTHVYVSYVQPTGCSPRRLID